MRYAHVKMLKMPDVALTIAIAAPGARAADITTVCFTPGGECTAIIVHAIDIARRQVLVQAYSFLRADC